MATKSPSLIDINTADEKLLISRLKINPRLSKRIIALRPFQSIEQLNQVWGIDEATLKRIVPLIKFESEPMPSLSIALESPEEMITQPQIIQVVSPISDETSIEESLPEKKKEISKPTWKLNLVLLFIFLAGAYFRFSGLNWDDNHHQHPDERFITMTAEQIRPVNSIGEYFNTEKSTLNPLKYGSYTYGMLPLFITRGVAEWLDMTDYDRITLVGRALSGIFDLLAVWMLFLVGKRLYSKKIGVLAAGLYSAAVFPIQMSHYFTVDSFSTVFVVTAVYLTLNAIPIIKEKTILNWHKLIYFGLFGLSVGMAGACKINALPIFGFILLASLAYLISIRGKRGFSSQLIIVFSGCFLALLFTFIGFRIFQPYAFTGTGFLGSALNPKWLDVMKEVTNQVAGNSDWPPNHHWTNRPFSYAWVNMVLWGLGIPLGLAGWAGWIWSAWRMWKGEWRNHLLPFTWVLVYFIWQNIQFWRYMRYFLPIYPFIILFAAWALIEIYEKTAESRVALSQVKINLQHPTVGFNFIWKGLAAFFLIGIVLIGTYGYAFGFSKIYTRALSRISASTWIIKNIQGPLNLKVNTTGGQDSYPIFISNRWILDSSDSPEIDIHPTRNGTADTITSTDISQVGVYIYFRISKQENGDEIVTEGRLPIADNESINNLTIQFGDITLNKNIPYYFRYKVSNSSVYSLSGANLRNDSDDSPIIPLDWEVQDQQAGIEEGIFRIQQSEDTRLNRLIIDNFQQMFAPIQTTIKVSLLKDGDENNPLGSASQTLSFDQPGISLAPTFSFPSVQLNRGSTYQVRYEILKGGPVRLLGEPFTLETSWDDALPLSSKYFDGLSGIYQPLNLELYEPDTVEKRDKMIDILSKSTYLVIPSNRAYDSMPRLPYRYPMTLKYYQELFDCECTGNDLENKVYGLETPFKSPLGFELVATFVSNPSIGPFEINDQSADESFTVYDHPKVLIFKKTKDFSVDHVRELLYSVNLDDLLFQTPLAYTKAPTAMQLTPFKLAAQKIGGTWSVMFNRLALVNSNQVFGTIIWYLLLFFLGWLVFPLVFTVFSGLPNRGYPLSRMAALLLIGWLSWILSSLNLLPFTRFSIILCTALIGSISIHFGFRYKETLLEYIKNDWKHLFFTEILFLLVFLFMLWVRIGNPDIWNPWLGGEKPMDFAFFNAVLKAVYFPPENPWFSEHYINYYYYGYVIAAIPTKLTGIIPSTAYNLILPSWFAMAGIGIYSISYDLVMALKKNTELFTSHPYNIITNNFQTVKSVRQWANFAGVFALLAVIIFGNFYEVRIFIKNLPNMVPIDWYDTNLDDQSNGEFSGAIQVLTGQADLPGNKGQWYFEASRPILNGEADTPIAEFPYFTFLYGDMHPHLLTIPFYALGLSWLFAFLLYPLNKRKWPEIILSLVFAGIFFGFFRAAHTWDFPIFMGLAIFVMIWCIWKSHPSDLRNAIQDIFIYEFLFILLAILFYMPFSQWFKTEYLSIEIWKGLRTPLFDYFIVFGLTIFIMISMLFHDLSSGFKIIANQWAKSNLLNKYKIALIPASLIIIMVVLWISDYQVLAFGLIPLLAIMYLIFLKKGLADINRITWIIYLIGLVITWLVEMVVLKGDSGRSNMVFRMYIEAWLYFGVANSLALAILLSEIKKWKIWIPILWLPGLTILILLSFSYPYLATNAKITDRWPNIIDPPHTLDGDAFMIGEADGSAPAIYDDDGRKIIISEDYEAIKFMQDNVIGSPVIIEGHSSEYRWGSRFSIHTGLPSIIGWSWHIRQHNSLLDGAFIEKRINELNDFYNLLDIQMAEEYIKRYDASYIIIGDLERAYYSAEGLVKFQKMVDQGTLKIRFGDGTDSTTTIYEVVSQY